MQLDSMDSENQSKHYQWLILLAMFYVMTLIATQLLVHKIVYFIHIYFSVAVLIFPLSFTISDIITEVYGYRISKQLLWSGLAVVFLFCVVTISLVNLPIPAKIHYQHGYTIIFDPMLRSYLACFIATMTGGFINIICISHWKILLRGRYFWLRSIGSTIIGEFIFTLIADPLIFGGIMPLKRIAMIASTCYAVKILYAILFAGPASICVGMLKQNLKDNLNERKPLNPFAQK
jgi:uncharacterized integral membrane protein (TIGR00697 family)